MSKFNTVHYNAIAKDIREEFAPIAELVVPDETQRIMNRHDDVIRRATLVTLAIRFAHRFKKDNEAFDPLKFLDACSPNTDIYPLSELWEES